ncbi:hypothetical protein [Virgibacillus kimchii]
MGFEITLAVIAVLGPIVSGFLSYKSAVKKSEANLKAIKIETENELEKIKEQALAEAKLHQEKAKTDITTKQFDNPVVREKMGNMLGSAMEKVLEKELEKHFGENK